MSDEQLQRTAAVLEAMDESFLAHKRGDKAAFHAAVERAIEIDDDVAVAVRGGTMFGMIPNPETDYYAWRAYVDHAVSAAAVDRAL